MSKKRALGQGLDALLGGDGIDLDTEVSFSADSEEKSGGILSVDISEIQPNPEQPRENFNEESLNELAESIKQQGVIQPVLAEKQPDGKYLIIAGERRWRAARKAGLSKLPVIERTFTEEQKLEIALVENIQREDLTPLEEARAYNQLMEKLGLSQQEVADKVGKNRSTVANSLRLLKLPENMKEAVEKGIISAGHARALLSVTDNNNREELFKRIEKNNLSVREAESAAASLNSLSTGKTEKSESDKSASGNSRDAEMKSLEQQFLQALGTKVSLKGSMDKGKIEISWYSREDLERIYNILTGEK